MRFALIPVVLSSAWCMAAEPDKAPVTPTTIPTAPSKPIEAVNVQKPFLGIRVDPNSASLDQEPGVPVSEIVAGGTMAQLGVASGDRLLTINSKPMESLKDLEASTAGAKVGDPITIDFRRAGQTEITTAKGTLSERPRPANLGREVSRIQQQLNEVKELADAQKREPSLSEILQQIKDIEAGLPRAVAAFKKQYPNGEFDIKIAISITSDKTAKNPVELGNRSSDEAAEKKPGDTISDEKKTDGAKPADQKKPDAAPKKDGAKEPTK